MDLHLFRLHGMDLRMKCGILARLGSFWIGVHWSPYNKRFCINLIPCVTFWVVFPGGRIPDKVTK